MATGILLAEAKRISQREMGCTIRVCGFEHREIGPHVVNVLYFSHEYEMALKLGTRYRMSVFVDGKSRFGDSF